MRDWSDICRGYGCNTKDECRRHLYFTLYEVRDNQLPRERTSLYDIADCVCGTGVRNGFIALDDREHSLQPHWWTL